MNKMQKHKSNWLYHVSRMENTRLMMSHEPGGSFRSLLDDVTLQFGLGGNVIVKTNSDFHRKPRMGTETTVCHRHAALDHGAVVKLGLLH